MLPSIFLPAIFPRDLYQPPSGPSFSGNVLSANRIWEDSRATPDQHGRNAQATNIGKSSVKLYVNSHELARTYGPRCAPNHTQPNAPQPNLSSPWHWRRPVSLC